MGQAFRSFLPLYNLKEAKALWQSISVSVLFHVALEAYILKVQVPTQCGTNFYTEFDTAVMGKSHTSHQSLATSLGTVGTQTHSSPFQRLRRVIPWSLPYRRRAVGKDKLLYKYKLPLSC